MQVRILKADFDKANLDISHIDPNVLLGEPAIDGDFLVWDDSRITVTPAEVAHRTGIRLAAIAGGDTKEAKDALKALRKEG